jgi:hypothetical protein
MGVFLRELQSVGISQVALPEWLQDEGVDPVILRTKIEFICRAGGLRLSDGDDALLQITIKCIPARAANRNLGFFYTSEFRLLQYVQSVQEKKMARSVTWSSYQMNIAPDFETLKADLIFIIQHQSEAFVNSVSAAKD